MDIVQWAKDNKIAAAAIGGGGLFFVLHKGHSAGSADVTSSDSTVDGAPADGEHVQLIPVSSGPAESAGTLGDVTDPSNGGVDGIDDTTLPLPDPSGQIPGGINVGGDLNSPIVGPGSGAPIDNSDIIAAINANGAGVSGAISSLAAINATTHPAGHPAYKTVIAKSNKYGGAVVYHERLSDHKMIPIRPASVAAAKSVGAAPAPSVASHPAAAPSAPVAPREEAPAGYPHKGPHGWYRDERDKKGPYHLYQNGTKVRV